MEKPDLQSFVIPLSEIGFDKTGFTGVIVQSEDNKKILYSANNNSVLVYDLETEKCIFELKSHNKQITALYISLNFIITCGEDNQIVV